MMNYSDYDSDGYSSHEDADYVPSDDNLSEDDINECEQEDPLQESDGVPHPNHVSKKNRKKLAISARKGKKGALKADGYGDAAKEAQQPLEMLTEAAKDEDQMQKKKSDDLWANFLSDVGSRSKGSTPVPASSTSRQEDSSLLKVPTLNPGAKAPEPATVTITKVFDFAGEEVRVNKEVSTDSKEAKSFLKSQDTKQEEKEHEEQNTLPSQAGPSAKRPTGMMGVLSRIGGKKPKMSTLEKSKLDWDAFKSEEGITEELAIHNRGREGYVERKKFLERVDHRQFQLEKTVRLNNMKQ